MAFKGHPPALKLVGGNGQISLGQQYVGRHVLVEESETGVRIVRTATVIPDNERWLHEPAASADLQAVMAWSASHPPADTNVEQSLKRPGSRRHLWEEMSQVPRDEPSARCTPPAQGAPQEAPRQGSHSTAGQSAQFIEAGQALLCSWCIPTQFS